ncbi:MAG: hypothetical protein KDC33_09935 [Thermoleophilia bacterium]|nr:hypothetical protein [Thermoleophilia bacterium]
MNDPYRLAGLADVLGLLLDGWQVAGLEYADRCTFDGSDGPAALIAMRRGEERAHLFLTDDGRAVSHRAVIARFRDHPHIWKRGHAGLEDLMFAIPEAPPRPAAEWAAVPEPFPEALELSPGTLDAVIPVHQVRVVDGVSIALTALESFAEGVRVHYVCHAPQAGAWAEMCVKHVRAEDDNGRLYRVASTDAIQRGTRFTGTLLVAPRIPLDARRFTVTIGAFGRVDADDGTVAGPWVFPISVE